jgi:hypothetical protein
MPNRFFAASRVLVILVACLTLLAIGCSSDGQMAPSSQAQSGGDGQWARVTSHAGAVPVVQGSSAGGNNIRVQQLGSVTVYSTSISINGKDGGVISFGRYVLTFPPGAFNGTKTITVESDDAGDVECCLYPEGLKFDAPVQLTMNLASSSGDSPGSTIYWHDPIADAWVDIHGVYAPGTHSVSAQLEHFCDYRTGRVGW